MQVDTFGAYVRAELDHWGREFALHRECNHLGHRSKSLLALLIECKGDLSGRQQGFRPLESDARAQMIESIIASIARDNFAMACAMRGYYCGVGRRKVERFDTANYLLARGGASQISNRRYLGLVELGFQRVRGRLEGGMLAA